MIRKVGSSLSNNISTTTAAIPIAETLISISLEINTLEYTNKKISIIFFFHWRIIEEQWEEIVELVVTKEVKESPPYTVVPSSNCKVIAAS